MRRGTTLEQKIRARQRALAGHVLMPKEIQGLVLISLAKADKLTPKCARLLLAMLEQTKKVGDTWIFDGSITVIAKTIGCTPPHSKVCVARFIQAGILTSTGRSNGAGKPKEYRVREATPDNENPPLGRVCTSRAGAR